MISLKMLQRLLLMVALMAAAVTCPAQQLRDRFDHLTTGFELVGQHRDLQCELCHANAIFKGTPRDCASCHGVGTAVRATAKTATHILATDRCDSCHTPVAWNPAVNFDHAEARGSCSTCHNNVQAQGKGPQHIDTDLECDACHTTISWSGAVFNHSGITSGCASCHNNVQATGPPATHIPIAGAACEACHSPTNFTTFAGANMNHAAVTSIPCATCHEAGKSFAGVTIVTRPPPPHPTTGDCGQCHGSTTTFSDNSLRPANHIPTSAPCTQCHTTADNYALYSVTGTHIGVTDCLSCHAPAVAASFANVVITSTPNGHIPTGNLDCGSSGCHGTTNVGSGGFSLGGASITTPTLSIAGHSTVAAAVPACQTCHQSAAFLGMVASTTAPSDARPTASVDAGHPASGDCGGCHTTAPTFSGNLTGAGKPANHIPTNAACTQCHLNPSNYATYSISGTHQGVTGCLACHAPTVAATFANVSITTTPNNHIPIGSLDCNGSGCHTTANLNTGGFTLGTANINAPTLTVSGHSTVAAAVPACQTCHQAAPYLGMIASTNTAAGDSRPSAALDSAHPSSGDCGGCHTTAPTFAGDVVAGAKPANHIPTTAACTQCHMTPGNFAVYSVTGTHQGVTTCVNCHAPSVAGTFANITITSTPTNHFPIGALDCNGSGCHTTTNVNSGGFRLGAASINSPTLSTSGHVTISAAVPACQTCHESAPYLGMTASSASAAGDSRPTALDRNHPTSGDCGSCHTTSPTFANNVTSSSKPANHIPTNAACTQCHTTAGNYAAYSVTGTHQGVTTCLSCHAPAVAGTFANITITTTSASHIPIGGLDCGSSGCHTTGNLNSGGFKLGSASITSPTLSVAGHSTVAGAVPACQTCHESAPYQGMIASSATAAGDSRPTAFDKSHPTSGDCGGCHTTTPTFAGNVTGATKPSNHIPTNAPCGQCHTTAGNYAAYVMGTTGHTGITSGCALCHAAGLSFANMAPPTLVEPPPGPTGHIPVGTLACELCHSITNFTTFSGTVMKHAAVRANRCDSCHEYGMTWKTNTGVRLWVRDGPNHHKGQDCGGSGCHTFRDKFMLRPGAITGGTRTAATAGAATATTRGAAGVPFVNARPHIGVPTGGSPQVPGSTTAPEPTKPADHMATTNACQSCHTSIAWLPVARVDHSQVKGTCVSCHSGGVARGKPSTHLPTSAQCETCHTTNAWTPARFDHTGTGTSTCVSCHNSVRAVGMPRAHVPTTQSCDTCHGTLAWHPAKLDHSAITSGCAACHNHRSAVGKSPDHIATQRDCATCHRYPDWTVVTFKHTAAAYPGQHHKEPACNGCHKANTEQVPYVAPADAGTCGGCHAPDFKPAAHPKTKDEKYTAHELSNCSGACHIYSDATHSEITKARPGPRHRVTDATFRH